MSEVQSNDQRQLRYEEQWNKHFAPQWVSRYASHLQELERFLNHDQFLRVVEDLKLYKDRPHGQLSDRKAVAILTYLNVKEDRPWFSMLTVNQSTDIAIRDFFHGARELCEEAHLVEIEDPKEYLATLHDADRIATDEYQVVLDNLNEISGEYLYDPFKLTSDQFPVDNSFCQLLHSQQVVAGMIHSSLEVSPEQTITQYVGDPQGRCDLTAAAIEDMAEQIESYLE